MLHISYYLSLKREISYEESDENNLTANHLTASRMSLLPLLSLANFLRLPASKLALETEPVQLELNTGGKGQYDSMQSETDPYMKRTFNLLDDTSFCREHQILSETSAAKRI
jgi:hypothetical protein